MLTRSLFICWFPYSRVSKYPFRIIATKRFKKMHVMKIKYERKNA